MRSLGARFDSRATRTDSGPEGAGAAIGLEVRATAVPMRLVTRPAEAGTGRRGATRAGRG